MDGRYEQVLGQGLAKPDTDPDTDTGVVVSTVRRAPEELAHLTDTAGPVYRYAASSDLGGVLRRFWIPVWSVPSGAEAPQRMLQDPACLIVITGDDARFYGVAPELSATTLTGQGWAVGMVLAPATGFRMAGQIDGLNDRYLDLAQVLGDDGRALAGRVQNLMAPDPHDAAAHRAVMDVCEGALRRFLPFDAESELVNAVVEAVENDLELLQVAQICEQFGIGERALQRLLRRRLGLTPKCLIQRRRLQEAAERLRSQAVTQAELAAAVGYVDQSHMIRDFVHITGTTPGRFVAAHRP
ncbi:hypothetical protein Kisp01_22980 [Kineosporia sp. NBRC 101677]|uniref:helix-turn-helix domain-containing protein n=1 Tax=Kineosporia sp. NBRC 101677 TaxID=3032197 RepID=UPI0024A41D86|nr:AraC family transcriptional regulator [Kineosporia sp. NBRC 101677]GLY15283.1 hypothetical protein Kisp01_22980 [Kineosporia sp. NBRC 101677]